MMERSPKENLLIFGAAGILFSLMTWALSAPANFAPGTIAVVPEGAGLGRIAMILEEGHVVRSALLFRIISIALGGERRMKAGEYAFASSQNAFLVAWRISRGDHRIETVRITVPEGFTVEEIAKLFGDGFPFFDRSSFEDAAPEGYLFPDTYFIPVSATATSTVKLMKDNFVRKIFPLMPDIEESGHSLDEIVTMASLLEAEATTAEDRQKVADVLWKRLKLGMPLQVDSDMGTYEFQGLPDRPTDNPGLVSLEAAVHPTSTPYLYFLSDKKGMMHYAKTFDEHQANIAKYLR